VDGLETALEVIQMAFMGPIPKRTDQKLGHRTEAEQASVEKVIVPAVPKLMGPSLGLTDPHPLARDWYQGLRRSGQAVFFEASDWQQARVWAELLSRALKQGDRPSAVLIAAWSSGAGELMTTEGARRRMRIELEREKASDPNADRALLTVTDLRGRLTDAAAN
jgi:hypothetical protein